MYVKLQEIPGSFSVSTHSLVNAPNLLVKHYSCERDFKGLAYTLFEKMANNHWICTRFRVDPQKKLEQHIKVYIRRLNYLLLPRNLNAKSTAIATVWRQERSKQSVLALNTLPQTTTEPIIWLTEEQRLTWLAIYWGTDRETSKTETTVSLKTPAHNMLEGFLLKNNVLGWMDLVYLEIYCSLEYLN